MSQAAAACRLYLLAPPVFGDGFADVFAEALDADDVACVMQCAGNGGAVDRALADPLRRLAHDRDVAFLVDRDVAAVRALGADGVHLPADDALYAEARAALGGDAIIGAHCGLSRHDAMVLAEQGADYVAFGGPAAQTAELVAWWAELIEVPCVAWDVSSLTQAREAARLGADFVAVGDVVWQHAEGPAAAVRELVAALADAREAA